VASAVSTYYRYENNRTRDHTWSLLPLELMMQVSTPGPHSHLDANVLDHHRLVEIDVGVMTACLPAFARMLHHHLPPWQFTKSRLSSSKIAIFLSSVSGKSKYSPKSRSHKGTPEKHSKVSLQNRSTGSTKYSGPYLSLGSKLEPNFTDDLEMGPVSSVQTVIGGGRERIVEEDGIHLKHDLSQAWSLHE